MQFDYFYPEESENYVFYRTPKVLCTDKRFRGLSSDAKLLYGILLDRIQLSKKNRWIDEEGHVYVYMTIESIEQALGRCHQKSCKVLKELVNFGLVEQKKQGLGKPTKLYVHNFGRVWDANLQKYETHTHGSMQDIPAEVCDSYSNNTEINNTDISDINPILSGRDVDKDERSDYREYLIEQLDMAVLYERYPYDRETLDSILDMLSDVGHGEYMGKTDYLMMINGNKILKFGTGECFIGSALIMKYDGKGLGFLSGDEFDEASKEFESRLITIVADGQEFSAYELL